MKRINFDAKTELFSHVTWDKDCQSLPKMATLQFERIKVRETYYVIQCDIYFNQRHRQFQFQFHFIA